MKTRSKRYIGISKDKDTKKIYSLKEAVQFVKETSNAKFDESIDLAVNLNVNPRQADQNIRSTLVLPHGTGKTKKVLVLTKGEKAEAATAAGADIVGGQDIIDKIAKGWLDFDVLIVTPDMMKDISKLGKILGPRGLMPNPKVGTVTPDIEKAVNEVKSGKIEFRVDSFGIVHSAVGRLSFDATKLVENAKSILETIIKLKPVSIKGTYVKSVTVSSTMGLGFKIDINRLN